MAIQVCCSIVFIFCVAVVLSQIPTSLSFAGPTLVSNQPHDEVIFLNTSPQTDFTITCQTLDATNTTNLPIAWYLNNIPLSVGVQEGREVNGNGELIFSPIRVKHTGWYTCAASDVNGRTELDFLVIVGTEPAIDRAHRGDLSYVVLPGSRVELPCLGSGVPPPDVKWFSDNESEIINGAGNGRYSIDNGTGSLVITGFTSADADGSPFYCELNNDFKSGRVVQKRNRRGNVTISTKSITISSPLTDNYNTSSSSLYLTTTMANQTLQCTSGIDLNELGYNISWTKDFMPFSEQNTINVNPADSRDEGFYCCQVLGEVNSMVQVITTHCVTVAIRTSPIIDTSPPPHLITLPSQRNRTANLICRASTTNNIDPPVITWNYSNGSQLVADSNRNIQVSDFSLHYSYVQLQDVDETLEEQIVCYADNDLGSTTASVRVRVVDLCQGANVLQGSNAENSNEELERYWTPGRGDTGNGSFSTVHNERVFVLVYRDDDVTLSQSVSYPVMNADYFVELSGRIRQEGSGVATIQMMVDGTIIKNLDNPDPGNISWQWVSTRFKSIRGTTVTLVLTMQYDGPNNISGVAYFDDLCMTFEKVDTPDRGLTVTHFIIIGVACGAVVILLLLIVIIVICCCCCCCCRRNKNVPLMRKLSSNVKKRFTLSRYTKAKEVALELSARMSPQEVDNKTELAYNSSNKEDPTSPTHTALLQEEDAYYAEVQSPTINGGVPQATRIRVDTELHNQSSRPSVSSPHEDYQPIDIQSKDNDNYYITCTPRSQSLEDLVDNGEQSNRRPPRTSVTSPAGHVIAAAVEEEETYYVTPHSHSASACSLVELVEDSGEYQNVEPPVKYLQLIADTTPVDTIPESPTNNFLSTSPNSRPLKSTRSTSSPMLQPVTGSSSTSSKKNRSISVTSPMSPPTGEQIYANDDDMNIYENSVRIELEESIYDN